MTRRLNAIRAAIQADPARRRRVARRTRRDRRRAIEHRRRRIADHPRPGDQIGARQRALGRIVLTVVVAWPEPRWGCWGVRAAVTWPAHPDWRDEGVYFTGPYGSWTQNVRRAQWTQEGPDGA